MKKLLEQIEELAEYVDFEMRAEFADRIDKLRKQIDSQSNEYVIDLGDAFPTLDKLNPIGYTKSQAPKRLSDEQIENIYDEYADECDDFDGLMSRKAFHEAIEAIQQEVYNV